MKIQFLTLFCLLNLLLSSCSPSSSITTNSNGNRDVETIDNLVSLCETNEFAETQENFSYQLIERGVSITGYFGSNSQFKIPSTFLIEDTYYPVLSIGAGAFRENKTIVSITLPNKLISIGKSAFADCSKLETINLPGSLEKIETSAFARSTLKYLYIPKNVSEIESNIFNHRNSDLFICCESEEKPIGWSDDWNVGKEGWNPYSLNIFWGVKGKFINNDLEYVLYNEGAILFGSISVNEISFKIPSGFLYKDNFYPITTIKNEAFKNCDCLLSLDLKQTKVKFFGDKTFAGCKNLRLFKI